MGAITGMGLVNVAVLFEQILLLTTSEQNQLLKNVSLVVATSGDGFIVLVSIL